MMTVTIGRMTRGGIGPPRTARSPAQAARSTTTAAATINTSPNRPQPNRGPTAASCPVIGVVTTCLDKHHRTTRRSAQPGVEHTLPRLTLRLLDSQERAEQTLPIAAPTLLVMCCPGQGRHRV